MAVLKLLFHSLISNCTHQFNSLMLVNYLPPRVQYFHFGKAQKMILPSFYFLKWELGVETVVE